MNYVITLESGAEALVSAQWDADVAQGNAESRIDGMTRRATRQDVAWCVQAGHDYR